MKTLAFAVVIGCALAMGASLVRASAGTTQAQAAVMGILGELRFSLVLGSDGKSGGPVRYRVTKETIRHLNSLMSDGATIAIDPQGKVTVE